MKQKLLELNINWLDQMPSLFIITGSNGAGKSSLGKYFLPEAFQKHDIFDGDKLYVNKQKELWAQGITAIKESKRLAHEFTEKTFDELVNKSLDNNTDFVYEGHFTNEATWDVPRLFKEAGYEIHLIFLGLSSLELSEARVVERAKQGGHYVDPQTRADNYYGNMEKLNIHFGMF